MRGRRSKIKVQAAQTKAWKEYFGERIRAVEVKEVIHANWTLHADGSGTCQHCHHHQLLVWDYDNWMHYCPTCGAEMIGAESDGRM